MEFLSNRFFLIALTVGVFYAARSLQQKTGQVWLNPILISIIVLIAYLKVTGISYDDYMKAGTMVDFWLQPTIVALGVPLYLQLKAIRQRWLPVLLSQVAGCVVGITVCVFVARWTGASEPIIRSLAAKSVTMPIAIEVTNTLGGVSALTAAVVVFVGLFGNLAGLGLLRLFGISDPKAGGLSMGAASHALGTARAWERGRMWGTYSSLGLILSGIVTALLAPTLVRWLM